MPGLLVVAAALMWLVPNLAQAESSAEKASLNWVRGSGAQECVAPSALAAQVEDWLGPVFVPPVQADVAVEGLVLRNGDAFEARITLSRTDGVQLGERRLRVVGPSCAPLKLQAAFVIAVTLDPEATMLALPPEVEAMLAQTEDPGELLKQELAREGKSEAEPRDPLGEEAAKQEVTSAPKSATDPVSRPITIENAAKTKDRMSRVTFGGVFGALPRGAVHFAFSQLWLRRFLGFDLSVGGLLPTKLSSRWEASGTERSFVTGSLKLRTGLCHRPLGQRVWFFSCVSTSASWYYASSSIETLPTRRDPLSAFNWGGFAALGVRLKNDLSIALDAELESNPRGVYFRRAPANDYAMDVGSESPVRGAVSGSCVYEF